jgi:acetyl-CoA carboxylase carboxyl transferase subunit alpha
MNLNYLDFEQPIAELQEKINELRLVEADRDINIAEEIDRLEEKQKQLTRSIFSHLDAWQIAQLARHPQRPYPCEYIHALMTDFNELHGDRHFSDDQALMGGLAYFNGQAVMVLGQQKGRDTKEKVKRNFGMMHPEGYRKALRLMKLAEQFQLPVITLIDTPGAFPGIGAEERNQSEAIARNIFEMAQLKTPIICVVTGEGCSGGALGIGVGDRLLMLQYSYYAVISPEGCASILWKSSAKAKEAAEAMAITADRLQDLGLIDSIIEEPLGGAHRDFPAMTAALKQVLTGALEETQKLSTEDLLEQRYQRFMAMGQS